MIINGTKTVQELQKFTTITAANNEFYIKSKITGNEGWFKVNSNNNIEITTNISEASLFKMGSFYCIQLVLNNYYLYATTPTTGGISAGTTDLVVSASTPASISGGSYNGAILTNGANKLNEWIMIGQNYTIAGQITALSINNNLVQATHNTTPTKIDLPELPIEFWGYVNVEVPQKVSLPGIAKVYVGSQLVYQSISVVSIALSGQTTTFDVGDTFTFDGTVTATYSNGSTENVTNSTTFSGYNMNVAGTYTVTASYTYKGTTVTATYSLTVKAPQELYYSSGTGTSTTKDFKLNLTSKEFETYAFTYPSGAYKLVGNSIWSNGNNVYFSGMQNNSNSQLQVTDNILSFKTWNYYPSGSDIVTSSSALYEINGNRIRSLTRNTGTSWSNSSTISYTIGSFDFMYDSISKYYYWLQGSTAYRSTNLTSWSSTTNPISGSYGRNYWSIPGRNEMFYSGYSAADQKHKTSSSWSDVTWTGLPEYLHADRVMFYNNNTYYIAGTAGSNVLYKLTSNYGWEQSNDFSLAYFNNNNITINVQNFWTLDAANPTCALSGKYTSYKSLEE